MNPSVGFRARSAPLPPTRRIARHSERRSVMSSTPPIPPAFRPIAALLLAAALIVAPVPSTAQNDGTRAAGPTAFYSETEVKAAFLYNFGSYVQWPVEDPPTETIRIAVLGAPAIAGELERFVQGRRIRGLPVTVHRLRTVADLDGDEMLFIGSQENRRLAQLIAATAGGSTLIVTDAPDGLAEGAMINFRVVDRRVRFEVSVPRAREAGLTLSSRLLAAALHVETTRRSFEQHVAPALAGALNREAAGQVNACGAARGRCPSRT